MRRKLLVFAVATIGVLTLFSLKTCRCNHDWKAATCITPQTCTHCGKTKGDLISHNWNEASYTSPKTCKACGATEGVPNESPYNECQTWEDVFRKMFSDGFSIEKRTNEYDNEKYLGLIFKNISSVEEFMGDTLLATTSLGMPEAMGINVKDDKEITSVYLQLKDAVISIIRGENLLFGVSTILIITEENETTKSIQNLYDAAFTSFDLETRIQKQIDIYENK